MGDRGDRETAIHRAEVENPLWANEWRRARVGLATRQRSDRELGVQDPRGQRDQIGPGVGLADRGLRARACRGRRAAAGPGGQHGPPPRESGRGSGPGRPRCRPLSPASLTSGASAEQHGGGEGQQEQQQQAGEESHGAAGQRPLLVR